MSDRRSIGYVWKRGISIVALVALLGLLGLPEATSGSPPLEADQFTLAAPQGFGDRQNSWAWAMQWWRGHLYVGTNRSWDCATRASLNRLWPQVFPYPPNDPDIQCAANYHDLDLRAEIWRWTPPNTWERVYQAPNNVPIPGAPGKFVARDVGYRGMTVFTEPDGTEALYVGSISPGLIYDPMPPPRILRSTDGVTFHALPQDPGTTLGDTNWASVRNPISFKGRLYVQAGTSQGAGELLEAENPAGGNNNFRRIGLRNTSGVQRKTVSAAIAYNGSLYLGTEDLQNGYEVLKTDAEGSPPYIFTAIVPPGAGLPPDKLNVEVLSMKVFQGRLYIGTNGVVTLGNSRPAEVIRVNPDDSWDVVVGSARMTSSGPTTPLSGYDAGFNSPFNNHMWRMEVFDDNLYIGTFDSSTAFKDDPATPQNVRDHMGFDLYRTPDGTQFTPISTTGFGDKFTFGVRSFAATPYGLFMGTANPYYGLKVYRGVPPGYRGFHVFLPAAQR